MDSGDVSVNDLKLKQPESANLTNSDEYKGSSNDRSNKSDLQENLGKKLIEYLKTTDSQALIPKIDFQQNKICYPDLKKVGIDECDTSVLDVLSMPSVNILNKDVYEILPTCPEHPNSLLSTLKSSCTSCHSVNIKKLFLIEHKVCGFISDIEKFGQHNIHEIVACPNCIVEIRNPKRELRTLGSWFICKECGTKFDSACTKLHCREFNHDFEIHSANYLSVPYYSLTNMMDSDLDTITLISKLGSYLTSRGFTIKKFTEKIGMSGALHKISIYGEINNKPLYIFLRSSDKVLSDLEINSVLAEANDFDGKKIVVCLPNTSDLAKTMAKHTGIDIIAGMDYDDVSSQLESKIAHLSNTTD